MEQSEGLDVKTVWRVFFKRRWSIVAFFVVVVSLVTLASFLSTPIYRAVSVVQIAPEAPQVVSFKDVVSLGSSNYWEDKSYYETQFKIIKSRRIAQKVLERLNLLSTPPYSTSPDPLETLMGQVSIEPIKGSQLINIYVEDADPKLAAKLCNALSYIYAEDNLRRKYEISTEALSWLGHESVGIGDRLRDAELELQKFKEKNNVVSFEESQNTVMQRLKELSTALTEAKKKRLEAQGRYEEVKKVLKNPELAESFPGVVDNDLIRQLKAELASAEAELAQVSKKYKPDHPEYKRVEAKWLALKQRVDSEVKKILTSFELDYKVALERENSIQKAMDDLQAEALALSRKTMEYAVMNNEIESLRQMYSSLKTRSRETEITGNIAANNITVIDAAETPRDPVRPRKKLNVALAIFVGLVGGIGLAFLQEYLDNTVKTQEELEILTRLPFLGAVPSFKTELESGQQPTQLFSHVRPRSSFAESCRVVRTNLIFSLANRARKRVLVTSPGPQEGKTTIVVNLGIILAQGGARVLIVDSDLRRPLVGKLFGLERDASGLTDLIMGRASLDEVIKPSEVANLSIVPSGPIPPNPAELLSSPRFEELANAFAERFDWVLFDSPPVVAVADSVILSRLVEGAVLIVESGKTTRELLKRANRQLADVAAPVIGVILNAFDVRAEGYKYYYYYRYYRSAGDEAGKGRHKRHRSKKASG